MIIDKTLLDELTAEAMESGTGIIVMKDGPYLPTGPEDIMQ